MTTETKSPSSETGNWHDPTNAYNDDLAYAYCGNGEGGRTHDFEGYGFAAVGIINEVRVDVKGYSGDGGTHSIKVYVWDGSIWQLVGTITSTAECFAHQFDATSYINTVAKLNAIKTRIESVGLGGGKPTNRYVRVCWIPVYADYAVVEYNVHLESEEDDLETSNLGTITFDSVPYSLPDDISKGTGDYQAEYSPATHYEFDHWEVSDGVSVANSTQNPTTATISSDGTLRAIYSEISYTVHLESKEDNEATSNLGKITFNAVEYTLPDDVSKEAGDYQAEYAPTTGYKFSSWETTDGISVASSTENLTTVTVSGAGTLRAIYSVLVGEWTTPDAVHSKCGEKSGYPATRAIDGVLSSEWWHNVVCYHWVIFDMGETKKIAKIRLYQSIGTAAYRWGLSLGLRVYVSDDPENWGDAVWEGALNAGGWQESGAFDKNGRYIKLVSKADSSDQGMLEFDAYAEAAAPPAGFRKLQYVTEPPTGGAFNKLRFASEPPVANSWNKILFDGE